MKLPAAVARADLIVVGNVTGVSWKPSFGMQTTLSVEQTLKGAPASTVVVTQGGGLEPTKDWAGATLREHENAAMLFPGDRAILLLQEDDAGYYIQSFSGWFQIVNGVVKPNFYNNWRASVEGKTEAEFVEMLKTALE